MLQKINGVYACPLCDKQDFVKIVVAVGVAYFEVSVFVEYLNLVLDAFFLFTVESVDAINRNVLHFADSIHRTCIVQRKLLVAFQAFLQFVHEHAIYRFLNGRQKVQYRVKLRDVDEFVYMVGKTGQYKYAVVTSTKTISN